MILRLRSHPKCAWSYTLSVVTFSIRATTAVVIPAARKPAYAHMVSKKLFTTVKTWNRMDISLTMVSPSSMAQCEEHVYGRAKQGHKSSHKGYNFATPLCARPN